MSSYNDIRKLIDGPETLESVSDQEIDKLKNLYSGIPSEYLGFLKEIGHGDLGSIVVYSTPINPVDVYTEAREDDLKGYVLFGDDMQGYCYAFDRTDNYRVVEIDPRGNIDRSIESTFIDFLRGFLS